MGDLDHFKVDRKRDDNSPYNHEHENSNELMIWNVSVVTDTVANTYSSISIPIRSSTQHYGQQPAQKDGQNTGPGTL